MTSNNMKKLLIKRIHIPLVFIIALSILMAAPISQADDTLVKIGVLAKRGPVRCMEKWYPTAEYLTDKIPDKTFVIEPLDYKGIYSAVENGKVDFILANPSIYVELESLQGINRIATLRNSRGGNEYTEFGGVIFYKANRSDIQCLEDLKDKTFMSVEENGLGGWRAAWREFKDKGIDPYHDFKELRFGGTHDAVVYAVRDGEVDAGSVRTDTLERMAIEGKINLGDFHVIHEHGGPDTHLPFVHSTRAYPEWPFAQAKHTPDELAEKVVIALLEMPKDCPAAKAARCAGWTIPLNYQSVHECLKELKVSPYKDMGEIILADVVREFWQWILAIVFFFVVMTGAIVSILKLNRNIREVYLKLKQEVEKHELTDDALRKSHDELSYALAELKSTQAQIVQAEKMASVGQLAAGIAHEINNPTGFVSSNLKTLADYLNDISRLIKQYRMLITDLKDNAAGEKIASSIEKRLDQISGIETEIDLDFIVDDIMDLINDCREGTKRIKKIVLDLKDFAHPGEDKLQATDINKGIESTLNVVWNELKYKATVTKNYGDLPPVNCYPQQLNQVFMNLFVNAAQAIEERGEIRISTRADNGSVEVRISDTGVGIPKENLSKIFDPFFTTKEVGKGTGLGMNIAYNIIKKHKGTIDVESEVGKGTTFTIKIPVSKPMTNDD